MPPRDSCHVNSVPADRRLVAAAVALAVLDIVAEVLGVRPLVYLLKPLATLSLALVAWRGGAASRYTKWITIGMFASLAGDVLLMLPSGLFVPGLVAFLLAHLCYITAFAADGAGLRAPLAPAVPIAVLSAEVLTYLWPTLGAMRIPVVCYVMVISAMSWQALARWIVRRTRSAAFAAVGSVFFLMSDSALAIRRFSAPFVGATLIILATYYAAQSLLALSTRHVDAT